MSTENTNTNTSTSENISASATPTGDPIQSMVAETPSSSIDIQQPGDFASWLNDKLDSFEKGQETAPWENQGDKESEEAEATTENNDAAEKEQETEVEQVEESKTTDEDKETEEEIKSMSGSAGAKFKELKNELKSYKSKVAEMEKVLSEREASSETQSSPQLEELRTKVEEYEREIAVARIEASPQFKEAVLVPTQAILDSAISLAEKYEVAPRKLVEALRQESSGDTSDALTELAADFSERDRVRLYRMADDLTEVQNRREYLKENASKAMAEMAEKQKAQELQLEKEYREEALKIANSTWEQTFAKNPVIQSLGEDVVKQLQQAAPEADLLDTAPEERAYAVYAGVALPHLVSKYAEVTQKLAEAEKALSKYRKASPKVSGNIDTSSQKQEVGGFLDAIEKRFTLG
jgi:hypothetical protein